jgi:hypothetical protein
VATPQQIAVPAQDGVRPDQQHKVPEHQDFDLLVPISSGQQSQEREARGHREVGQAQ